MAQTTKSKKSSSSNGSGPSTNGVLESMRDVVSNNPAAGRLLSELQDYARNRAQGIVESLGDRIGDTAERLEDYASNGAVKKAGKSLAEGDSPLKAGAKAVGAGLKDKVAGMFGGDGGSGDGVKATSIAESIEIGVPASVAYNQWTQFEEFGRFTKGVQKVDQEDETTTNWTAKIAFSTRSWKATITDQVPDERIAWTAEGDKGSVDGVVTFHELAPNLTKVLLELEYHPKGLFERTGNLWRAQGRRARLDLKNFRRFVMMRGEETGAWRGEIEDSEVVRRRSDRGRQSGDGQGRRGQGGRREDRGREDRGREDRGRGEERRRRSPDRDGGDERSSARRRPRRERSAPRARRQRSSRAESNGSSGEQESSSSGSEGSSTAQSSPAKKSASRRRTARKRTSGRKTAAKKSSPAKKSTTPRKRTPAKKSAAAGKSTSARKTTSAAKRSPAKKTSTASKTSTARKRSTAKKTSPARKRTTSKKSAPPRKRAAAKKSTPRKSTPRKSTPRKSTARKSTARKSTARK